MKKLRFFPEDFCIGAGVHSYHEQAADQANARLAEMIGELIAEVRRLREQVTVLKTTLNLTADGEDNLEVMFLAAREENEKLRAENERLKEKVNRHRAGQMDDLSEIRKLLVLLREAREMLVMAVHNNINTDEMVQHCFEVKERIDAALKGEANEEKEPPQS